MTASSGQSETFSRRWEAAHIEDLRLRPRRPCGVTEAIPRPLEGLVRVGAFRPSTLAICTLASLPFLSSNPLFHGIALALLHVALSVFVVRAELARRWRWAVVSPIGIIAAAWTGFLAVPAIGAYGPARADPLLGYNQGYITLALAVSLVALGLLYLGYRLGTRRCLLSGPSDPVSLRARISVRHLVALITVGWAARLYLIQQGAYGYIEFGRVSSGLGVSILDFASGLAPFGLALLTWQALQSASSAERRHARVFLAFLAVPLVLSALISGFKAQLLTDMMPALLVYLAIRRRLPRAVAVGCVAFLVLSYVGVETFRADIAQGNISFAQSEGAAAAATAVVGRVATGITNTSVGDQIRSFTKHFVSSFRGMSRNLGVILHRTPDEIPELGLRRYLRAPLFFLPIDVVSPEKMPVGQYVNVVYLNGQATSSSPPTQPGDLYLSGGWPALVVGQLLFGWLLARLWLWVQQGQPQRLLLYALLAASLVNTGEDLGNLLRAGAQTMVVYGAAIAWLFGTLNVGPRALSRQFGLRLKRTGR